MPKAAVIVGHASMNRVWARIALVFSVCCAAPQLTHAACEAETCELDCAKRCPSYLGVRSPACYETCLESERTCRRNIGVVEQLCRSMNYYGQALELAKQIRRSGLITDFRQCRETNAFASALGRYYAGEDVETIINDCGCFVCNEAFGNANTQEPSPPPRNPLAECPSISPRLWSVANGIADCQQVPSSDYQRCRENNTQMQMIGSSICQEAKKLGCPVPIEPIDRIRRLTGGFIC